MLILDQPTHLASAATTTQPLLGSSSNGGISSFPVAPATPFHHEAAQPFPLLGLGDSRRRRVRPMSPQPLSFVPHQLSYHDHIPYQPYNSYYNNHAAIAAATSSTALHAAAAAPAAAAAAAATTAAFKFATTTLKNVATTATTAAFTVLPTWATTTSFLKLAAVFVAGGLFFSSCVAFTTASLAIGQRNIKMFRQMAKIVWESVWLTFTMGLTATKETLLLGTTTATTTAANGGSGSFLTTSNYNDNDDKNGGLFSRGRRRQQQQQQSTSLWRRYREAWNVLLCQLAETRRKAMEGVQAIQKEMKLCAAAVGAPGLIPLQYMLDRQLHFIVQDGIRNGLIDAIGQVNLTGMELKLSHFDTGTVAPKLESARVYDLGEKAMAFDYDITWESELEATIQVQNTYLPSTTFAKLPVTLHDVYFRGPVRIIMAPLTSEFPGFGATLVSFPSMPEIGMDIRVAGGEVTKVVPMVRAEIMSAIEKSIEDSMIWPKRVVVPSYPMNDPQIPILPPEQLKELETTDPLLEAEEAIGTRPVLRRKLNQMSDLLYNNNNNNCNNSGRVGGSGGRGKGGESSSSCNNRKEEAELLKSIVDLPMPSFQHHKKDARENNNNNSKKKRSTTTISSVKTPQQQQQQQYQHLHTTTTTTTNKKPGEMVGVVPTTTTTAMKQNQQVLWDQIQQAHQVVVDRSHADIAKTEQLLKNSSWWNDMKKIQLQAKEKLKELQFSHKTRTSQEEYE